MKKNIRFYIILVLVLTCCLCFVSPAFNSVVSFAESPPIESENIIEMGSLDDFLRNNESSVQPTSDVALSAENDNYNLVYMNYKSNVKEFIYYDYSATPILKASAHRYSEDCLETPGYTPEDELNQNSFTTRSIIGTDERVKVSNTTVSPYRMVSRIVMVFKNIYNNTNGERQNLSFVGTAFLDGPNFVLTAGHNLFSDVTIGDYDDGIVNRRYPDEIYIQPAVYNNGSQTVQPYGRVSVVGAYIQKEYYNSDSFDYDWGVCVLSENLGYRTGWFGKSANNTLSNYDLKIIGYPGDHQPNMYESSGKILSTSTYRYEHNADTTGGNSGSPMIITKSTGDYVCGVHTSGSSSRNGGTKINTFIYHFLNSLLPAVSVENYNKDSNNNSEQLNCLVRVIWDMPCGASQLELSSNGSLFTRSLTARTYDYYASGTSSAEMQLSYPYARAYYSGSNSYSAILSVKEKYTVAERSAKYSIKNKTNSGAIISTSYDQSGNLWVHNGSTGQTIKGTIAYNGEAKNIEVSIPLIGYKYSSSIVVGGVTFQLRCGPSKVSIKASKDITCNFTQNIFAFALV